jgi:hypothetical protein
MKKLRGRDLKVTLALQFSNSGVRPYNLHESLNNRSQVQFKFKVYMTPENYVLG